MANVYGFGTSQPHYYFNKELSELSLPQVALLAGIRLTKFIRSICEC